MINFATQKNMNMALTIILILVGVALLAKHQCEILRFRYKQAEICPAKLFPMGPQCYRLTILEKDRPKRPTMFIPLLACWVKRPLFSEIAGILIIFGSLYWAWNYFSNFPLILSIALGGISWIFITKFVMTIMLKLCDYPSVKLVVVAMAVYPILFAFFYCVFSLLTYFNLYKFPF